MRTKTLIIAAILAFSLIVFSGCSNSNVPASSAQNADSQKVEWLSTTDFESGIGLLLPRATTVVDEREKGGSLVFVSNDKAWTLSIMPINVSAEIAEALFTDPDLAEQLKTGYQNSVGKVDFLVDEVSTLNGVDVLHIKYQYTKDDAPAFDDHIVFTKNGKLMDIMMSYAESSDITEQIITNLTLE